MKELSSSIEIDASPERVWQVLTDFGLYPQWNPFIRRVRGKAIGRARLLVRVQPSGARGMTFRPVVTRADPGRELRWRGGLLIPGLLDREHIFVIEPLEEGRVRFSQRQVFSGLLAPLLARGLHRDTRRGFEEMAYAFKERAERKPGQ